MTLERRLVLKEDANEYFDLEHSYLDWVEHEKNKIVDLAERAIEQLKNDCQKTTDFDEITSIVLKVRGLQYDLYKFKNSIPESVKPCAYEPRLEDFVEKGNELMEKCLRITGEWIG